MKRLMIIAGFALSGAAYAQCSCECVNGQVQAICTNVMDMRPICSPQVCQITQPSIRPIEMPRVPPIGTTSCSNEQVYNRNTGQYEWRQICR